jgi:hypothetical protein
MEPIIANALSQIANQLIGQALTEIQKNPQGFIEQLSTLFGHSHTGEDVIQDVWDAVKAGHLSHAAGVQATVILAADLERKRQKPATPPIPTYADALEVIRQSLEYLVIK